VKNVMMDPVQCFHHAQNRPVFQVGIRSYRTYPTILSDGWTPVYAPKTVSKALYALALSPTPP
jgi:hypothetical protein